MARKLAVLGVVGLLVPLGVACPWLLRGDPINQGAYEQIRLGMPLSEVRIVLGEPGSDLSRTENKTGPGREALTMQEEGTWGHKPDDNEPGRRWTWAGQDAVIMIRVDRYDRVTDKMLIGLKPLSSLARLRLLVPW